MLEILKFPFLFQQVDTVLLRQHNSWMDLLPKCVGGCVGGMEEREKIELDKPLARLKLRPIQLQNVCTIVVVYSV